MGWLNKWMMRYLRNRGWVVFYLDENARACDQRHGVCWLQLHENERKAHDLTD